MIKFRVFCRWGLLSHGSFVVAVFCRWVFCRRVHLSGSPPYLRPQIYKILNECSVNTNQWFECQPFAESKRICPILIRQNQDLKISFGDNTVWTLTEKREQSATGVCIKVHSKNRIGSRNQFSKYNLKEICMFSFDFMH